METRIAGLVGPEAADSSPADAEPAAFCHLYTITAEPSPAEGGFAIGGGRRISDEGDWTCIVITGGTVTASSSNGAGIGAGNIYNNSYTPTGTILLSYDDTNGIPAFPEVTASSYIGTVQLGKGFKEKDGAAVFAPTDSADGVTVGVDETHYGPEQDCTRSQAMTVLWRAKGSPEPESTESPFSDVTPEDYYSHCRRF